MPKTDLIQHRMPTYKNAVPRAAKPSLYTTEELLFQKRMIPELIDAGIIVRCESPWSAKTRFPRKSNGKLRMVYAFTGLNDVTVKSNYPMRRIEPILKDIAQPWVKYSFSADAANGYWAVPAVRAGEDKALRALWYLRVPSLLDCEHALTTQSTLNL